MNIFVLDKNYNNIGVLSNQGANPTAPYFDDLYTQELETGADTFEFTTLSTSTSQDMLEIGNHIIFEFNNRQRLFAISTLEFEHKEGMNVVRVYAEGVGFQLLETYLGEFGEGDDTDGDVGGETHTYETFLAKVLADTDWNYVIVSGELNNIDKEVTFTKGKNIYALLQDSMQTFDGVELEFRAEYSGGGLNKTIYAYANKGRGSFVGQRFEYGFNVNGIRKTQEIVDEMDENTTVYEGIIRVDGLDANIALTYDVDFALRSHEVEELEIGDTHYVIDNDFHPPLQIDARIGKIEISFSDPTKNKCYLANFKRITGSTPSDPDGEDVDDMIDDKLDELDDRFNDIEDRLDKLENPEEEPEDPEPEKPENIGSNNNLIKAPRMHSYEFLLYVARDDNPNHSGLERMTDHIVLDNPAYDDAITSEAVYDYLMNEINVYDCSPRILDDIESKANGTNYEASNYCFRIVPDQEENSFCNLKGTTDYTAKCNINNIVGSRIFSDIIDPKTDRPDFEDISNNHSDRHMLDVGSLSCALLAAMQYHVEEGGHLTDEGIDNLQVNEWITVGAEGSLQRTTTGIRLRNGGKETIISPDAIETEAIDTDRIIFADGSVLTSAEDLGGDVDLSEYATKSHVSDYYLTKTAAEYTYATKGELERAIQGLEGGGNVDLTGYATEKYVNDAIANIETPDLSDYATKEELNGQIKTVSDDLSGFSSYAELTYVKQGQMNDAINAAKTEAKTYTDEAIKGFESLPTTTVFDTITVNKIKGPDPGEGQYNRVKFEDAICVDHIWSASENGTINFEDDLILHNNFEVFGDISTDGKVCVNEGIQFADGSVLTSASGFSRSVDNNAAISALQEEMLAKDQEIADLKARLERIEAMLGINNN